MIVYFYVWDDQYQDCALRAGELAVPYQIVSDPIFAKLRDQGVKINGVLPSISAGYHDEQFHEDKQDWWSRVDGIYIGNQGQLETMKNFSGTLYGDFGLNIFNSYAADFWKARGLKEVTFSYELSFEDLNNEWDGGEILVYGRVPVMVSEYCPIAGAKGIKGIDCGICETEEFSLNSQRAETYPFLLDRRSCRSTILSAAPIDRIVQAKHFERGLELRKRICIFQETPEFIMQIMDRLE